jgi:hypothetical protein
VEHLCLGSIFHEISEWLRAVHGRLDRRNGGGLLPYQRQPVHRASLRWEENEPTLLLLERMESASLYCLHIWLWYCFPGFCGNLGAKVSITARELGYLGRILAFTVSIIVYSLLCTIWPTQSQQAINSLGLSREDKAIGAGDFDFARFGSFSDSAASAVQADLENAQDEKGLAAAPRISEM